MFTYALEAFDVAPILALCSPLKRCGKTTTEEVTTALAKRPLAAANITVAALYRTVEQFAPTLIVDEADTFLLTNLALRGILNSGHTRATAFVVRTAGHEPRLFSTWGARMIALIGRLPATLEDRAIVLPMRRRAPGEAVDRIRRDGLVRQCDPLRRRTARWVAEHLPALRAADPAVPAELDDRQADNWRPLLAIADEAGGAWPDLARTAARRLAGAVAEADTAAPVQLLADLRELFTATDGRPPGDRRHHPPLDRPRGSAVGRLRPGPAPDPAPSGHAAGGIRDPGEADSPGGRHAKGIHAGGLHRRLQPLSSSRSETPEPPRWPCGVRPPNRVARLRSGSG